MALSKDKALAWAIIVDGVDIRDMARGKLRLTFGMVLQDTRLFTGTIRANIGYGRTDGYGTVPSEEASNISQGGKRLPTIVTTRTEVFIQRAMKTLMKGRTSFVIAHRLLTIRDAAGKNRKAITST